MATLEWGWTINAFYLSTNRRRSHWILWTSYLDDNWCPFRWVRVVLAHAPRRGVPLETAAVHLLLAGIRAAPELIYAPFRIEVEGLLTVPDLVAMKRLLWPD